ncbi:phage tail protein, partial [Yersinia enterocolitica]|nr:phage tail protein [Yersinia enterocolitica]
MFHLDNETGVPVMPNLPPVQSNTTKWFTEGGNGIPPSWPGEAWFNIIQAEILNVLAAAGITPDKENLSQLSEAITTLISSDSNNFLKVANNLSEIEAAGPAAVAAAWNHLGIGALLTGALQKTNNLSEIKTAGPAAVA